MTIIGSETLIHAPPARVFDLSRSIEFHLDSTEGTEERAIAGVTTGLIGLGEQVTWEARHLGVRQRLTVEITRFDRPNRFQDTMISGAFKHMIHDHVFDADVRGTRMIDRLEFSAPYGWVGRLAESLILRRHMRRFLDRRNAHLKRIAESESGWKRYLKDFA